MRLPLLRQSQSPMAAEPETDILEALAPAKINLFLHVIGRRQDGYHLLESLVSFADIGDKLTLEPGPRPSLEIDGPFSRGLDAGDANLVLKAVRAFVAVHGPAITGRFHLTKNLPVASGIGGGSSDAAAALRLLARANHVPVDSGLLADAAATLGADVPVCLDPTAPRLMQGIGHELGNRLYGKRYPALLVNPGIAVETRAVFAEVGLIEGQRYVASLQNAATTFGPLICTRNDLEAAAIGIAPEIRACLDALQDSKGYLASRMSGSGATCFAIFDSRADVKAAAQALKTAHPGWWIAPCHIKVPD